MFSFVKATQIKKHGIESIEKITAVRKYPLPSEVEPWPNFMIIGIVTAPIKICTIPPIIPRNAFSETLCRLSAVIELAKQPTEIFTAVYAIPQPI